MKTKLNQNLRHLSKVQVDVLGRLMNRAQKETLGVRIAEIEAGIEIQTETDIQK